MRYAIILLTSLFLLACSPKPRPIEYGADACEYCSMTIVDNQHAAEAVTAKGKVYKFDAIECMVNYTLKNADTEMAFLLVNPYTRPGELIPAGGSTFLISKNLPSPMGAFLSAFPSAGEARAMQAEKGGTLYDWEDLVVYFREKGDQYYITKEQ